MSSIPTSPWSLLSLQLLVFTITGFTKPCGPIRFSAIALIAALGVSFFSNLHHRLENRAWTCLLSAISMCVLSTAIVYYINDRVYYATDGPTKSALSNTYAIDFKAKEETRGQIRQRPQSNPSKFWFAIEQLTSRRRIGTPWQVKAVPAFSARDPAYVPSRASFLMSTAASIFCSYLVWDLSNTQPSPDPALVAPDKQLLLSRIQEVTLEELLFRTACAIGYWFQASATLRVISNTFGFIAVASGFSEPAAWPPGFGPLSELYSIRQFWGVFWHQYLRVTFEGISSLIVRTLRIPKNTLLDRYSRLFISFLVSGVIHIGADWGATIPLRESGAMRFFITQAFGIMLEDAYQALYYRLSSRPRPAQVPRWHKFVGFAWLVVWMMWSIPVWVYPQVRTFRKYEDAFWPFSLYAHLIGISDLGGIPSSAVA